MGRLLSLFGSTVSRNKEMDSLIAEERIMKGRRAQAVLRHRCSQLGIGVPAMESKLFDVTVRSTVGMEWKYGGLISDDHSCFRWQGQLKCSTKAS